MFQKHFTSKNVGTSVSNGVKSYKTNQRSYCFFFFFFLLCIRFRGWFRDWFRYSCMNTQCICANWTAGTYLSLHWLRWVCICVWIHSPTCCLCVQTSRWRGQYLFWMCAFTSGNSNSSKENLYWFVWHPTALFDSVVFNPRRPHPLVTVNA